MGHHRIAVLVLLSLTACGGGSVVDAGVDGDALDTGLPPADLGAADAGPPVATTSCGPLVGARPITGVSAFLGIPFAAPPTGTNRFRPPQPATCWTGERDATHFGAICQQPTDPLLPIPGVQSLDCLTLNVWTPDVMPPAPLPVMVWLYGGAFVSGGTTLPLYEGARLAAQGVVVVTVNYRLGADGWLAHPALTAEDPHHTSGNYGLLDQIAGLQWVHDEIAAFGGDATRVTVFGESAGAASTCSLVGSPLADGLFARVIVESGSCVTNGPVSPLAQITLADAEARGMARAAAVGCTTGDVPACLRTKSSTELRMGAPGFDATTSTVPFNAVVDGYVLPRSTAARLMDASFTPPPILLGTNHDEAQLFTLMTTIADETAYEAAVNALDAAHAAALLGIYPASDYATPKDAFDALLRDAEFTCPTRALARLASARQSQVFLYQVSQVNAAETALGAGTTHGGELAYVFDNFTPPFLRASADERVVVAAVQGYWTRFAATGDPNGAGAAAWPAFTTAGDAHLELATPITTETGLRSAQCDALAALP